MSTTTSKVIGIVYAIVEIKSMDDTATAAACEKCRVVASHHEREVIEQGIRRWTEWHDTTRKAMLARGKELPHIEFRLVALPVTGGDL